MLRTLTLLSCFATVAAFSAPVRFASKNIDWGEVAQENVSRSSAAQTPANSGGAVAKPLFASAGGTGAAPAVIETRTITLDTGTKLRIRERIEPDGAGGEDRVFESGEQMNELSVVATEESLATVLDFLRARGLPIVKRHGRTGRILRVRVPQDNVAEVESLLAELAAIDGVSAERNQIRFFVNHAEPSATQPATITPSATPNDPGYSMQWGLQTIGAPEVWANGFYGYPNIPCAVFDTGVLLTHEDLQINVRQAVSALNSDPNNPNDHHGHGSHCLGIMGADGNNGKGVCGVGQVANLTSIRGPISYWQEGDDINDGFQWALDNGIKILSCSFGTPAGQGVFIRSEYEMFEELKAAGILVVIAAGNDANNNDILPAYPASYDNDNLLVVVAAGQLSKNGEGHALDPNDYSSLEPASFSSFGAESCDIAAPGVNILSCTRAHDQAYEAWDGTSMATPMVAACAAMVWEQNPSWSYLDVKNRLMATASRKESLVGYCQTAGCVNLAAAMKQTSTVSVAEIPKLLNVGTTAGSAEENDAASLTVTVKNDGDADERIHAVRVTLLKTRDDQFAPVELVTIPVPNPASNEPQTMTATVWTPTVADAGRGYSFKIEALDRSNTAMDVFCFSNVFRVQDRANPEAINILSPTAPAGQSVAEVHDAGNFTIQFTASAADWVQLTLQEMGPIWNPDLGEDGDYERNENGDYLLDWVDAATLGLIRNENPGSVKYATVQLKGRGWNNPNEQYRVKAVDMDLSAGEGTPTYSCPFTFRHSSCSVWLMPGDPSAAAKTTPREHLGECSQTWKADDWTWSASPGVVRVGEEVRVSFWLPETSVYWLLLRDEETGGAFLMKQIEHSQVHPGYQKLHTIGLTIPTHIGDSEVVGRAYRLMLVDAFATEMRHFMPVPFTLVGEEEPTFAEVFGDATEREYETSGFWYPVSDPKAADGRSLKCAWVGEGENASFQTTVTGPVRMTFKVRGDIPHMTGSLANYSFGFHVDIGEPPVLDYKDWTPLADTQFSGTHPDDWTTVSCDIPAGTHALRFIYQRDDAALPSGCANSLWIDDITFTTITAPINISINESTYPAQASYSGGPAFPGYVTYTIDGTDPTAESPRWVSAQRFPLMQSTTIKARAFNPGCTPSDVTEKVYVRLEADNANKSLTIRTADDLIAFAKSVTNGERNGYAGWTITLANDIDMTGRELPAIGTMVYDPHAQATHPFFRGTFDGGNHVIIAPTLITSSADGSSCTVGFIGAASGATVRDLTLLNPVIERAGANPIAVGFIVGANISDFADGQIVPSLVENCHVINGRMGYIGNTMYNMFGNYAVGGITGTNGFDGDGKVSGSSFTGTINGSTTATTIGTPPPTPVFLPAPIVTPGSRPYSDPLEIHVTAANRIEVTELSADGKVEKTETVASPAVLTLNDRQHHTFQFRAVGQVDGETRCSPPVIASYGYYTKPLATGVMIGLFNEDGSIIPASNGSLCPPLEKFGICANGFFENIETRLAYDRTWTIRYTLDGTEPTLASLRYEPGVPFTLAGASVANGKVTIKAKAFHDLYAAGATATTIIELQHDETTDVAKLGLLKVINGRQTAGQYQGEDFTVVANPPPPSHRFSHWRVVGPLVLTNAKRKEITFRFTFTEPITLEAIYEPAPLVLSVQ